MSVCDHAHDYRQNWTSLSPITIIKRIDDVDSLTPSGD